MKNLIIVFILAFVFASCSENEPPSIPSNPYPPDNSTVPTHVNFSWKCDDPEGDKLTYNLFINDFPVPGNLTQPFYTEDLAPGNTYLWYVIVRDSDHSLQGPIWIFTTESKKQEEEKKGIEPKVIADETVKIGAGSFKEWTIYGKTGEKIHFEVKSDLSVNVLFLPGDEEMANYAEDKPYIHYAEYSGQQVYTLTKDFPIPQTGYFYLVVDNKFSWFTSKTVYVKITIG